MFYHTFSNTLISILENRYLTDNMLTGDLPAWMLKNKASNKVNMCVFLNAVLFCG
jgi:hypothetical protein